VPNCEEEKYQSADKFPGVQLRGIYPEVLGQEPLTFFTYFRDFYHGGMCQFNLTVQSIGFPLLYWPHLGIQVFMTIFSMAYDGWLCTAKLAGPNMDVTVPWLANVGPQALLLCTTFLIFSGTVAEPVASGCFLIGETGGNGWVETRRRGEVKKSCS
jgi:hypothetical protein